VTRQLPGTAAGTRDLALRQVEHLPGWMCTSSTFQSSEKQGNPKVTNRAADTVAYYRLTETPIWTSASAIRRSSAACLSGTHGE
jgi:hypothetical protein